MPVSLAVDVEKRIAFTICSGLVVDEEFIAARQQVQSDPQFDPAFDRVWDFSEVTEEQITDQTLAHLVGTSQLDGYVLRAVVVPKSPRTLARTMDFVAHSRQFNYPVAVFPTLAAAQEWIATERALIHAAEESE